MAIVALSSEEPFHHIALRVADAAETKIWYQNTFGLNVDREFSFAGLDIVFLRPAGGQSLIIEVIGGGTLAPSAPLTDRIGQRGFSHICLRVDDVEADIAALRARGITIFMDVFPGAEGSGIEKGAFVEDPWGNLIELVQLPRNGR